jgi:hypothetical protein
MIRDLSAMLGIESLGVVALIIFVVIFTGVIVWAVFRPRKQINKWSRIPLEEEPVEPRGNAPTTQLPTSGGGVCCCGKGGCSGKKNKPENAQQSNA